MLISTDFLSAVADVESGGQPHKRGRHGEVSEYQILPRVWKQYCPTIRFSAANPNISRQVAEAHASWLSKRFLARYHRLPTSMELYAMWNLGFTRFSKGCGGMLDRCPTATRDAALRVKQLLMIKHKN